MPRFTFDAACAAALLATCAMPVVCIQAQCEVSDASSEEQVPGRGASRSTGDRRALQQGLRADIAGHHALVQRAQVLSRAPPSSAVSGMGDALETPAVKVTDAQFATGGLFRSDSGPSICSLLTINFVAFSLVVGVVRRFFPTRASYGDGDDMKMKQALVPACEDVALPQPAAEVAEPACAAVVFNDVKDVLELAEAVRAGDAGRCEALLGNHRLLAKKEDHCGCSALHVAADCGSVPLVRLMCDSGASVNASDAWEETPLHFAARAGSVNTCEFLLARRAELDAPNSDSASPLLLAAQAGKEAVCELLLSKGAGVGLCLKDEDMPPILTALLVKRIFEASAASPWHSEQTHSVCRADLAK